MLTTGLDPKVGMWLNIAAALAAYIASSAAAFTTLFGEGPTQKVVAIAGLAGGAIATVNAVLHAASSNSTGPMVSK